ncbi:MAG TPA: hypothetical protein VFR33_01230 [Candidatus Dormibacteraeota bacterium]|nr:hypothetical protein [Candidatus Dormibacteraeota bacterium]
MAVSQPMAVGYLDARSSTVDDRVRRTVALLRRRGYAVSPARLGQLCLAGAISESEARWIVAADPELTIAGGLVVDRDALDQVGAISERAGSHRNDSPAYVRMTVRFVRMLVAVAPFIRHVSIAGSLASGGFRASDDVDLNLIVDDGHRHLAYVAVNLLGVLHAMRHRSKPVDDLTRRPVAPRLMTANLILERSQCLPLERQDEDMAFELLVSEPVFGMDALHELVAANQPLLHHFPQLAAKQQRLKVDVHRHAPSFLYPSLLDRPAEWMGRAAWRYMQWTRRNRPGALARVAFVRATMRPYTLFDES